MATERGLPPASLPPLAPGARELMEVLWTAPRPLSTRAVHDAVAERYPARAGRAIQTIASVLLMGDPRDLGLVTQVRSPHAEEPTIYLYEAVPGGIGLSERLWQRHDELIAGAAELIAACGCEGGCPSCTGPRLEPDVDARALALRLLRELGAGADTGTAPAAATPTAAA